MRGLENSTYHNIGFAVLEGKYDWITEILALLGLVVVFNFIIKILLKRLHLKFEKQRNIWQDSFVNALLKPLSYYIWYIALINSVDLISLRFKQDSVIDATLMRGLILFGGILAFAWFLLSWKSHLVMAMMKRSKEHKIPGYDQGRIDMMGKIVTIIICLVTIMLLLEASGRSIQTLIAFGGISGLAIAFASQEIIANFFSGLVIYMTRPFSVGDWVMIPEKEIEGHVEEIGWYTTCVRTFEKRPIYVPNSIFSKLVVMTPSRMSHRQIKEKISIRYRDKDKLQTILDDIKTMLVQHHAIDTSQRMLVHFNAFGDHSLDILIDTYSSMIDTVAFADVKQDVLLKISNIIEQQGAEIAFPSSVVEIPYGVEIKNLTFEPRDRSHY